MNIAAYCRVSTNKEDQLNSLATQKQFFRDFSKRNNYNLVNVYADEGISGTKIKNRTEFQHMMADAERGMFEMLVVKDISRFARNTVDLLQSVRQLKAWGIETQFVNSNMTSMGNSEFILTIFGAIAQEESYNISQRVKFSKKINAEKGRVPNLIYGYDKIADDMFHLNINEYEADVIRDMYRWYTEDGDGAVRIANRLNSMGITTKRGYQWSHNAVHTILTNEIYKGKLITNKSEIEDFLVGKAVKKKKDEWFVLDRPDLQIVDSDVFEQAQKIMADRYFRASKSGKRERESNKHLFSTLIKCKECGSSFRRVVRVYKNTFIFWVCMGRDSRGASTCPNATKVNEDELIDVLQEYFESLCADKEDIILRSVAQFRRIYKGKSTNSDEKGKTIRQINKLQKVKERSMDLYVDGIISRKELNERVHDVVEEINQLEEKVKMLDSNITKDEQIKSAFDNMFKDIGDIINVREMTNAQLKRIVDRIEVDKDGHVDIYLKVLGNFGLDNTVLIRDTCTHKYTEHERFSMNIELDKYW